MFNRDSIYFRPSFPIDDPDSDYPGFQPGTTLIKEGTVWKEGHYPVPCDIIFERDTAIPMRDGTVLYADIFRPANDEKVPVLLNSTTFGKARKSADTRAMRAILLPGEEVPGLLMKNTSGLNTFEGTDPGYFVKRNYAVVNLDIRGAYMSGGKNYYFGTQEAEDDYDAIEWLGTREWCNGAVAMTGNSWLGIVQWFAAALRPPHLKCIAPWEGWQDMYRDEYMVGGIPNFPGFRDKNVFKTGGEMEDVVANIVAHPLFDEYWEDKAARADQITVPAYVTASWSSQVHCQGTLRAFRMLPVKEKWLRVHNTQEWHDTWAHNDELLRFFDRYLKGIENGWEEMPQIRVSVLDNGAGDFVDQEFSSFPPQPEEYRTLYLDAASMELTEACPREEDTYSYCGYDGKGMAQFRYTFREDTAVVGYIGLKLWVSVDCYDDMDLFVRVIKENQAGEETHHYQFDKNRMYSPDGYMGPSTRQRVSLRKVDPDLSQINEPYHPFDEIQKLKPFEIVPVEIGLFPTGMFFHAGETLKLQIAGYRFFMLPDSHGANRNCLGINNNGYHIIHTGKEYDSRLSVPIVRLNAAAGKAGNAG